MRILVVSSIYPGALERLESRHDVIRAYDASREELLSVVGDREVIVVRSGVQITREVMENAPDLKLVVRAGSGTDNIDLAALAERGLELKRIPGPGARAVAEMTFALLLALARNVVVADDLWRSGHWAKHELTGHLLQGKTLGIVGAGNIGSTVGEMAAAWGMDVIGCVEHPDAQRAAELAERGIRLVGDCGEVLAAADFVTVHVPLKPSTRGLIDADALALMKPGAFLVNIARGGIVDEAALREALVEGRLAGAALDVHEHEGEGNISPLADLRNVVLTPHIGAGAVDTQRQIGDIIVESIEQLAARLAAPGVNGRTQA